MQRTYQLAGRCEASIQRGGIRERVRVIDDDGRQSRAFEVIRRDSVEMRLADRYGSRPAAQVGGMQGSDGRLLDRK